MAKNLVIVESPAKAKTIKKFLRKDYEVIASYGHVRDLPKSTMGVDPEDDFEPHYITIRGKGEVLASLRKEVKKASKIYLATDPDREGEAISYHLSIAMNLDEKIYFLENSFALLSFNSVRRFINSYHPSAHADLHKMLRFCYGIILSPCNIYVKLFKFILQNVTYLLCALYILYILVQNHSLSAKYASIPSAIAVAMDF